MRKTMLALLVILLMLILAGCPTPNDPTPDDQSEEENSNIALGTTETVTVGSETLTMICVNNQVSITFPTGTNDSDSAILTTKFFMGETEVTNAVIAEVLQWAYDNARFSSTVADHNGLDITTAKHGGKELLELDDVDCRVDYNGSDTFSAETGYENNPVTNVTWYGSVIFCNWLTEMRDGNTSNVVYTGIDDTWWDSETIEDVTKTGYRLPSSNEWEYTARYRGSDSINTVYGYTNPNYTKGDSASGATANYTDEAACRAVAVYDYTDPNPYDEAAEVKSLGSGSANTLGLFDMSGNVMEWCYSTGSSGRVFRGGSWSYAVTSLGISLENSATPTLVWPSVGFRLCRTAD